MTPQMTYLIGIVCLAAGLIALGAGITLLVQRLDNRALPSECLDTEPETLYQKWLELERRLQVLEDDYNRRQAGVYTASWTTRIPAPKRHTPESEY